MASSLLLGFAVDEPAPLVEVLLEVIRPRYLLGRGGSHGLGFILGRCKFFVSAIIFATRHSQPYEESGIDSDVCFIYGVLGQC